MSTPLSRQPLADEHVFLIGRPPLGEFLGFVVAQTVEGGKADHGLLAAEWRSANDHIQELEAQEAGAADGVAIVPLPTDLTALATEVMSHPVFRRAYALVPTNIGIVELDRLVVYQKKINLAHVRELQARLGAHPNEDAIFRLCLPIMEQSTPFEAGQIAQNAFMFISPSNDIRFMEAVLLEPRQIAGYQPRGQVAGIVGLVVGFSANCLSTVAAEGRLILSNGSHRAYALRDMGITHVPCVIQHVSRREELQLVAGDEVARKPDLFLKAPRPPMLKDYFDPKLRKLISCPRRNRQVKVAFGDETLDTPATA